ncbi:MAG: hypothetical protein KH231_02175 [Dialister sp.]|uniref:hypothetical protein n=1 Tax=Dialister sp. TaxID=1955814 RepID=UPI001DADD0E4|nr:hypothetical protein [Dialister sp.]MBS6714264.1 hypothetical protein [Dialister sp.]
MLVKALEKIIINGTIVDVGETYDGTAEELTAYISGGYVEVLERDEDMEDDPADNQNEEVDQEVDQEDEEPEETPKEKPKTTRRTVRRTKKTGE